MTETFFEPEYLKTLNSAQKEAVLTIDGPLLILAGAGAGKTKAITYRILHLIKQGVRPRSIIAITFTNKAAGEMRERVKKLLEEDRLLNQPRTIDEVPFVSTFHSLGVHMIKENCAFFNLPRHFAIFDKGDSKSAIKSAMETCGIDQKTTEPAKLMHMISKQKSDGMTIDDFLDKEPKGYTEEIVAKVWREYEHILNKEKALDFDDLLLKTLKLLKNPEILAMYQERWKYIHIDEYQDTNKVQYDIAKLLAEKYKNIAVIGDIDQCLVAGTKVTMSNGNKKPIDEIKLNDEVLSNYGSGDFRSARVTKVFEKDYSGEAVTIITESGKKLTSTPEHTHFGGFILGSSTQHYFTYLMYKKNKGYRIGVSQTYTKGQKKSVVGFIQRCNHEHGDKVWILGSHNNPNDARILEYKLSLKYALPTIPFVARKNKKLVSNGIVHDQKIIDAIFKEFDTTRSGENLLNDYNLLIDAPHHLAQSRNSNRNNITITLCGDRRGKNPMHRIAMVGNDLSIKKKLESGGFKTRLAKKGSASWRFETGRIDFGEVMNIVSKINLILPNLHIIRNARLGGNKTNLKNNNSLSFFPAGSFVPGMVIFNEDSSYEVITKVERKKINTKVYDLNINNTHNFIANGIITHNSVYSWRGADFKNIMRFEKDFENSKTILFEQNYRSTKTIISVANTVIAKNIMRKEKNLFTENEEGDQISLFIAGDEKEEAHFIARTAKMLIDQGVKASEIAVLYRANFQSRVIEEACLRKELPYELIGTKFFERKEVKDTLSYIKGALNPDSLSDLKRIINTPARGIGKVTMLKIFEGGEHTLTGLVKEKIIKWRELLKEIKHKAETMVPSEVVKFVIKNSGIEVMYMDDKIDGAERLENIRELVTIAAGYDAFEIGEGMEKFLEHTSLSSDQDEVDKKEGIKLMTIHAAKGLEFDYVFIGGMEQGQFPHERMGDSGKEDAEEERRLFYVALTRARKKIYLSYTQMRTIYGSRQINTPSEFLADIGEEFLQYENGSPNEQVDWSKGLLQF